jgi:hypothetical protein
MRRPFFRGLAIMLSVGSALAGCAAEQTQQPQPGKAVKPPPPARPAPEPEPAARPAAAPRPLAFKCENVCAKNRRCADAIAKVMTENLPIEVRDRAARNIKNAFATDKCVQGCRKSRERADAETRRMTAKLKRCFNLSGCKAYSICLKDLAK